ncbi:MAG: hypothetical protein ABSA97_00150 [Verrucomicrobiia bacterium]
MESLPDAELARPSDDGGLVGRARAGDLGAFEELVKPPRTTDLHARAPHHRPTNRTPKT